MEDINDSDSDNIDDNINVNCSDNNEATYENNCEQQQEITFNKQIITTMKLLLVTNEIIVHQYQQTTIIMHSFKESYTNLIINLSITFTVKK